MAQKIDDHSSSQLSMFQRMQNSEGGVCVCRVEMAITHLAEKVGLDSSVIALFVSVICFHGNK